MSIQVRFPKLYFHHTQPGAYPEALITYGRRPYEQRLWTPQNFFDGRPPVGKTEQVVRYSHLLILDLWFIKIKFEWKGGWHDDHKNA